MPASQSNAVAGSKPGPARKAKFITPPTEWKQKVVQGNGLDIKAIEQRAGVAMQQMLGDYLTHAAGELARIEKSIVAAGSATEAERDASLQKVRMIAHEIRNEAGTLGYAMLTKIGASLCDYIDGAKDIDSLQLKAIAIHADAMRLVVAENMSGDGGEPGKALFAGIQELVSKTSGG